MNPCCNIEGLPSPEFFKALSDPTRLEIFAHILARQGAAPVGDIATQFSVDKSVVSRHLGVLRASGLLVSTKKGKEVHYSLNYENLARVVTHFASAIEKCCPTEK